MGYHSMAILLEWGINGHFTGIGYQSMAILLEWGISQWLYDLKKQKK